MKRKTVLNPLEDLSPEVVEPEPDRPAPAPLESIPAGLREPQRVLLPVREPEHFYYARYRHRHWGMNE